MIETDVLIVGGGPAGSSCAWRLRQANISCLVIDQQRFPRVKVCGGWLTPDVLRDLHFTPQEYPHGFTTFTTFEVTIRKLHFRMPTMQHAIRRVEFDNWLLKRSGAQVFTHTVKNITQSNGGYEIDGEFCGKYLVGAGGTHCPVYRSLFSEASPRPKGSLIVAQEEEFEYPYTDDRCQLWFLQDRLPGYAWYVPKANGVVNVGVGGKAKELKANGDSLKNHWNRLVDKLEKMGLVVNHTYHPAGHSYYLNHRLPEVRRGNAFLAGDAAGLATVDMGEGISPAIKSGLLAAEAILSGKEYSLEQIPRYSIGSLVRIGRRR
jgi:geranylgeranyl reductase family protein